MKAHAVVLAFAITIHKMQGQTCSRLILDINQRSFKPLLTYHGLYFALLHVRTSSHLRVLLLQPLQLALITFLNYTLQKH